MQCTRHHPPAHHLREHGAALFMALIFLLIMTILGIFGMNVSRLENMMAGNLQFQATALNNAEYVLVRGENDINNIAASGSSPFSSWDEDDHYYTAGTTDIDGTAHVEGPADLVWAFTSQKVSLPDVNNDGSDTDNDGTADDGTGRYIIENAGLYESRGEDGSFRGVTIPLPGAIVQAFLVSAQSSSSKGAKRTVQSVVVTDPLAP